MKYQLRTGNISLISDMGKSNIPIFSMKYILVNAPYHEAFILDTDFLVLPYLSQEQLETMSTTSLLELKNEWIKQGYSLFCTSSQMNSEYGLEKKMNVFQKLFWSYVEK